MKTSREDWIPERVYKRTSGAYEYHPREGGSITIAKKGASKQEVLEAYRKVLGSPGTVSYLKGKYCESDRYMDLAESTKRDYELAWGQLNPVFGHVMANHLKPSHIRLYMDKRSSKKRANTERIFLKNILAWGLEYDWLNANPCIPVKPFKMKARKKYVTDTEYSMMYDSVPDIIKVFMELSYICAARGQDVRELKLVGNVEKEVSGIVEKGLFIKQGKTGKMQIKLWNPRLKAVLDLAKSLRKSRLEKCGHTSPFLLVTTTGGPYTSDGLKSIWQKSKWIGHSTT